MKSRLLSLLLAVDLLLPAFTGCSEETKLPSGSSGERSENGNSPAETEPDYSDFVMPEATDKLTVYGYGFASTMLSSAVGIFRRIYPEVEVDIRAYDEDEYRALLRTEIPAGKGPDFVFGYTNDFPDVYKTMKTGLFEDLNPYLENDAAFDFSEYNQAVLDGGLLYGRRYILPLRYSLSLYLTTEENLRDNRIDAAELETFEGFIDACTRYHAQNPDNHLLQYGALMGGSTYLRQFCDDFAFRLIDYQTDRVVLDKEAFRRGLELCGLWYSRGQSDVRDMSVGAVLYRRCLFLDGMSTDYSVISNAYTLRTYGETPVFAAIPDEDDGVTAHIDYFGAIPKAAENKLNAYRLLKILLSREIQLGNENAEDVHSITPTGFFGIPVHTPSLKRRLELFRELLPFYNPLERENMPELPEEDTDAFFALTGRITRAVMLPPILLTYIKDNMEPYLRGKAAFDDCYDDLLNVLELYKDE